MCWRLASLSAVQAGDPGRADVAAQIGRPLGGEFCIHMNSDFLMYIFHIIQYRKKKKTKTVQKGSG